MTRYTKGIATSYNKKIRLHLLATGDMVLKWVANTNVVGKLESKWEALYIITRTTRACSYYIVTSDREPVDRTWNVKSLDKFYP